MNLLNKENSWQKIFFADNAEWSFKNLWKWYLFADAKAIKNNNK